MKKLLFCKTIALALFSAWIQSSVIAKSKWNIGQGYAHCPCDLPGAVAVPRESLWPKSVFRYAFAPNSSDTFKTTVKKALKIFLPPVSGVDANSWHLKLEEVEWEEALSATRTHPVVIFEVTNGDDDVAESNVGVALEQPQKILIPTHQMGDTFTIAHEAGHALGMYHAHQRPDRDHYLTVFSTKIDENSRSNWETVSDLERPCAVYRPSEPFDYQSIMLYYADITSSDYERYVAGEIQPLLVAKNPGASTNIDGMGVILIDSQEWNDRPRLSQGDRRLLQAMYPSNLFMAAQNISRTRKEVRWPPPAISPLPHQYNFESADFSE